MVCIYVNNLYTQTVSIELDTPPSESDGLIDHPQVSDALLIFTVVATVIFISIAVMLIVFTIALRKNKYATIRNFIAIQL